MAHIIIKDSENPLETSAHGTQLKINTEWSCLCAVGQHCFKNRHNSAMKITTGATEHFQKSLSVNTVHSVFYKYKLKVCVNRKKKKQQD